MNFSTVHITQEHHTAVSSTQILARQRCGSGVPFLHAGRWHWIVSQQQTMGQGQYARGWLSPPGGFYGTLCFLWPRSHGRHLSFLPLVGALCVAMAVEEELAQVHSAALEEPLRIKWVNDVFLGGKKVSGVLGEVVDQGEHTYPWITCLLGIGVNLRDVPLPLDGPYEATSVEGHTGHIMCVQRVRCGVENALRKNLPLLLQPCKSLLLAHLHPRLLYRGEQVFMRTPTGIFHGHFVGLDPEGGVVLRQGSGGVQRFLQGKLAKNLEDVA